MKSFSRIRIFLLLVLITVCGLTVWKSGILNDKSSSDFPWKRPGTSENVFPVKEESRNSEGTQNDSSPENESYSTYESTDDTSFSLTMLDVGQGLALLIRADGHYMLYDGGGRDYSSYVVAYLKQAGITELDYMVASHYDADHINGLVGVLNTTTVLNFLGPDYTADTDIYRSLLRHISQSGLSVQHPITGDTFLLGGARITVISDGNLPQNAGEETDENNYSIALRITYGNFSCIITGDAENEAEKMMLSSGLTIDSDLYVAGHHGSSSSSSEEFVQAISPKWVFISCGEGNEYGHPTSQTMKTIRNSGAELFRTDKQGEVTFYTDGTSYSFSTAATDDWSAGVKE